MWTLIVTALIVIVVVLVVLSIRRRIAQQQPAVDAVLPELRNPFLYFRFNVTESSLSFGRKLQSLGGSKSSGTVVDAHANADNRVSDGAQARSNPRMITYQPAGRTEPCGALLWIHGGGMVLGKPEADDKWCRDLADELGIFIVNVAYRLAPEHPFPAGLDDCMGALGWLHENAAELGIDPARIAVGGASAGAGLAASVSQRAQKEGTLPICFALLNYPMLDDRTALSDDHEGRGTFIWTLASNRYAWNAYLGGQAYDDTQMFAAPGRCQNLAGQPPAWIGVGSLDLFYPEDLDYAARLEKAGVDCELVTVEGMYHAADMIVPKAESMRSYRASMVAALGRALN